MKSDKKQHSRLKNGLLYVLISIAVNALVASLFAGISAVSEGTSFWVAFEFLFPYVFGLFGGPAVVAAILMVTTKIPEDSCTRYGMGFYYGTALCCGALLEYFYMGSTELAFLLSAVIVGLICYVFWLKNNRTVDE